MDQSSATNVLLEVASARTRSQSRNRDSSLLELPLEPPPSLALPLVYYGLRRYIHFKDNVDDTAKGPSITIVRSTRSKALVRLINKQTPSESTPRQAITKRRSSTKLL